MTIYFDAFAAAAKTAIDHYQQPDKPLPLTFVEQLFSNVPNHVCAALKERDIIRNLLPDCFQQEFLPKINYTALVINFVVIPFILKKVCDSQKVSPYLSIALYVTETGAQQTFKLLPEFGQEGTKTVQFIKRSCIAVAYAIALYVIRSKQSPLSPITILYTLLEIYAWEFAIHLIIIPALKEFVSRTEKNQNASEEDKKNAALIKKYLETEYRIFF